MDKTFAECAGDEPCTIYHQVWFDEYFAMIMRGPVSVNAYVGVRPGHPLYGLDYNSLDVRCHGGLTYASEGTGEILPAGFWWFGWDYAHAGDKCFFDLDRPLGFNQMEWDPDLIRGELPEVIASFRRAAFAHQYGLPDGEPSI
jgi:hypothetical protein